MAKMVRFFEEVEVTSAGIEFTNIIGGIKFLHTGDVQQITIRKISGSDTTMDIQIRYISGNGDLDKLVYLYDDAIINSDGFIDSNFNAPFSCATRGTDGDMHLFLQSAADCVVSIRIDFDINNHRVV
jgi:hypothetical protein